MKFAFSPSSRSHQKSGKKLFSILAILFLILLAGAVGFVIWKNHEKIPVIYALDPSIGEPGSMIRIAGTNFGPERGDSVVMFDNLEPTGSSYLTWSDKLIELMVPLHAESALVRVKTKAGKSNSRVFMSRALLPSRPEGLVINAVAPVIDSLSSISGKIGSSLVIRGLNFGNNRSDSEVLFTWNGRLATAGGEDSLGNDFISPSAIDGEYLSWSDKEIRVVVPDGAASGGVFVRTSRGSSSIEYFQVEAGPGIKSFTGGRKYALANFVTISRVKSEGDNEIFLWIPAPVSSPSQRGVSALSRSHEPYIPDYKGLVVYRLEDLLTDRLQTVSQDWLVQVFIVNTEVKAERVTVPSSNKPPVYELYTREDSLVNPGLDPVESLVKKLTGKEKNHYRLAKILLDGLLGEMKFNPEANVLDVKDAFTTGEADAWTFSLAYTAMLRAAGIPALPVAGVLVNDDKTTVNHAWTEFYIYGLGWVPVDPVLYSGETAKGHEAFFEDASRYFGNLDERHLAFSRGYINVVPNSPDGRTVSAERRYSFQAVFEEAVGEISAYTSFWSDVEITGIY